MAIWAWIDMQKKNFEQLFISLPRVSIGGFFLLYAIQIREITGWVLPKKLLRIIIEELKGKRNFIQEMPLLGG